MTMRLFSDRRRPVHMGPYPLERLERTAEAPDLAAVPPMRPVAFNRPEAPASIVNAMGEYQAMLDAIRDGLVNKARADAAKRPAPRTLSHAPARPIYATSPDACREPPLRRRDDDEIARFSNLLTAGLAGLPSAKNPI